MKRSQQICQKRGLLSLKIKGAYRHSSSATHVSCFQFLVSPQVFYSILFVPLLAYVRLQETVETPSCFTEMKLSLVTEGSGNAGFADPVTFVALVRMIRRWFWVDLLSSVSLLL